ncbi:hypothetical protein BFP72_00300 [Reichenbachiella sp. 5M10]|uniref:hypothetical protein n=1 Tax=Reichenbachiella sp. 5M10 TaxID=1889772 RepID=UPI000C156001|nr:hypothetical protein [Reichenbachiella sp. 5M10]PIB33980.1 hypothetical protein BFP72_00300 [Reichenbachiella sp. 5M10]
MSIKSEYSEQLEAYFSGEMKGADRLVFEGRVESDPMLKAEFEHQSSIIDSLKAQRIAELKTRLDNVAVETTLIGTLLQSAVFKPALYAVTGLAVSVGAYMYFDEETAMEYHLQTLQHKSEYTITSGLAAHDALELNYRYEYQEVVLPVIEKMSTVLEETKVTEEAVTKEISFEVPEIDAGYQQDEFVSWPVVTLESPQRIDEVPSVSKMEKINIQTIASRKYNFHYRMEDNRLYLYGKFDESPYEIIEINTPGAKKLFFYYDGQFYSLNKDAALVTPLARIENKKLINELDVIKSNNL